jgi:hypothetical protein
MASWAGNVILWMVPEVFGARKGGETMAQSLVRDEKCVVNASAE